MTSHDDDAEQIIVPAGPDPAIVAALVQPLTTLRASLGTGSGAPDPTLAAMLRRSTAGVADSDADHAAGIHALESSLVTSADAVPVMRQTRAEISAMADQSSRLLSVLTDAHATNAEAARKVDRITLIFRRDAREVVDTATTESAADRVLALGAAAYRDALSVVDSARADMAAHRARLSPLRPLPVSVPRGYDADAPDGIPVPNTVDEHHQASTGEGVRPARPSQQRPTGNAPYAGTQPAGTAPAFYGTQPAATAPAPPYDSRPATWGTTPTPYYTSPAYAAPQAWSGIPGQVPGQPMDPETMRAAITAKLQESLIRAGVELGGKVIDGLADVGLKVVDRVGDGVGKVIDGISANAEHAIKDGLQPHEQQGKGTPAAPGAAPKAFDFGPDAKPATPAPHSDTPAPAPEPARPPSTEAKPAPAPAPTPPPPSSPPFSDAPAPHKPDQAPATAGPLPGHPAPPTAGTAPRKGGQYGVTVTPPAPAPAAAPVVEPTP
jgi:hypothetical protein